MMLFLGDKKKHLLTPLRESATDQIKDTNKVHLMKQLVGIINMNIDGIFHIPLDHPVASPLF